MFLVFFSSESSKYSRFYSDAAGLAMYLHSWCDMSNRLHYLESADGGVRGKGLREAKRILAVP